VSLRICTARDNPLITPDRGFRKEMARDAAIGKCIRQAHLQYPNEEQQMQRADVYKACMVAAGFQP